MIDKTESPASRILRGGVSPCRVVAPRAIKAKPFLVQGDESQPTAVTNSNQKTRKLALAVNPYKVAMSVSSASESPVCALSPISYHRKIASPLSRYQQMLKSSGSTASSKVESARIVPTSSVVVPTPIRPSASRYALSTTTSWHDERLMKSLSYSSSFQRRLEEQAAEAIRKAEERTIQEYEKKMSNCLKTIEAVEKRKKNDLRLVELRKKAEMERIQDEFEDEMFKQEMKDLKEIQEQLKAEVLLLRAENTDLQQKCRDVADRNKQLMAEIECHRRVLEECEQHKVIVAKMENIDGIFLQAHLTARQDLARLDDDCRKEVREKKKVQKWIDSLVALMDERCTQPKLIEKIHRIEARAKAQHTLITDLRRARQRSSKRSQRSGSTTVLRREVNDMRKRIQEQDHIFDDRVKLSVALASKREQERQKQMQTQHRQQFEDETTPEEDAPREQSEPVAQVQDLADKVKKAMKTNRRLKKRRKDIEDIVNEMKNLEVKEEPPDVLMRMLSLT